MGDGYKRGARGIDGRKGEGYLNTGSDDGNKSIRELTAISQDIGCGELEGYRDQQWKPGPVSRGGHWHSTNGPPKPPASTKPVAAASPSGKYAKKGGAGQRSGA
jgi:hypothetical protein